MDVMGLLVESDLRHVTLLSEVKDFKRLVKNQIDLTQQVTERVMDESRQAVKFASATREEYRAWFDSSVGWVTEGMGKTYQDA